MIYKTAPGPKFNCHVAPQADKELVNFRRETTCLLKQHEGEKDQAILHSILSIVGQCLGMTDTDFQETVLRMVDEAEVRCQNAALLAMLIHQLYSQKPVSRTQFCLG